MPTAIQGFANWSEPQEGPFSCQEDRSRPLRHFSWSAFRCLTVTWWSWLCRRGEVVGIIQIGDARGMGILSGLGGDHQCVVAFDLQPAAVEHRVVAQVGVETNVPARRRILVVHRFIWGVPHQLVQAGDGYQFIPVHPVDTPYPLVTRPADTPAQEEVLLSPVQAGPGVSAGTVNEFPMPVRLCALQPERMYPGVAYQPWSLITLKPCV